ncbi:MAG: hypothetical protein K6C95_01480 [Lachnospiraceae bacterium]|nr:hypothetical protein [Lachnospiraceae bacterium]
MKRSRAKKQIMLRYTIYAFIGSACILLLLLVTLLVAEFFDSSIITEKKSDSAGKQSSLPDIFERLDTPEEKTGNGVSEPDGYQQGETDRADIDETVSPRVREINWLDISENMGESYLKAAEDFAEHLEERIPGSSDTARFGLFDMDFDGMPELIMHDLTGEYVCFCTYRNESMSERTVLYDNIMNKDFARSCALFDDRNIHLIYEISGGSADGPYREYIKTDVMRLDEAGVQEKLDELMLELVVSGDSIETHYISINSGDEREIDGEEYYSILAGHVGKENADSFRLSDGIPDVIDGDYDFAIGRSEAGTDSKQRLTLDELKEVLGSGL